ncbi:MAG: ABC transporter ATP-binding protein [bacterium]
MARVVLENVSKKFGEVVAVNNISLDIKDKEFMVMVGPSGCGKTTTLRMIAGLEEINSGNIYIDDRLINEVPPKDRDIAMVFQNYALYPHMNVYDNMSFGLKLRKVPKPQIDERVDEAAEILGIKDLLKRLPKQLSGGQRQRVAVGRAIVRHPKVFLMDEPLSNLDAKLRVQMRAELKKMHARLGATIIYVTHDQVEAMTLGDRLAVILMGQMQQAERPLAVYGKPSNRFVAGFIGSPPMNFIDGKLQKKNGATMFMAEDFEVEMPQDYDEFITKYIDKEVVFGIRPEDILDEKASQYLEKKQVIKTKVDFRELMGSETYLYVKAGKNNLTAKTDALFDAHTGDQLKMSLNLRKLHLFDKTTQETII